MRQATPWWAGLALLALAGVAAGAEPCRYSAPRNVDLEATTLKSLLVELRATDAHVVGVTGLSKIEVRGTACASDRQWLDDLQIDAHSSGSEATITARTGDHDNNFNLFGGSRYAYLKLNVSVPSQLAVAIRSGSGDVVAASLAALDYHSGSGDLKASQIAGPLTLELGSADVDAHGVGSVDLHRTGSGDVTVSDVGGEVRADHSGSGDLHFSDVKGNVSVGSVGSGDVRLANIAGDVQVDSIGSGELIVDGVTGKLDVGATGSGDVSYHDVKGSVHVPSRDDD